MTSEPGQRAFEARFAGFPTRCAPSWDDLPEEAKAVWRNVEQACCGQEPDSEQLLCGARAIGRTIDWTNHMQRAAEVWRAMVERDPGETPR